MRVLSIILVCLFLQSVAAHGAFPHLPHNEVGSISGRIMGNLYPVSNAEVTLMQKDHLVDETHTDENGYYTFTYIEAGKYDIKAAKAGYRTSIITEIPVEENSNTRNDLYLPVFTNQAPRTPIVETYRSNYNKYIRYQN